MGACKAKDASACCDVTPITVGDSLPDAELSFVPYIKDESVEVCSRPVPFKLHEKLKGKKVVLFAVPGAFTPTCQETHVVGFRDKYDDLKAKGVDAIYCASVNDGFVMGAWAKVMKVEDKMTFLGDGSCAFFSKIGMTNDYSSHGLGVRAKRLAMIVDDLKVTYLGIEPAGGVTVSGVDAVLENL